MFRLGVDRQPDPAIDALFITRGMIHVTRQIPLPGKWSMLGGISLNAYASPDGLWLAVEIPSAGQAQTPLSWTLVRTLPGLNVPYVAVSRKGKEGPLAVQGEPLTFESIDFDNHFAAWAVDRRAAVMLIDQGMMQWLMDCDRVSFHVQGDKVSAVVQSGDTPSNPSTELNLLFRFCEGFVARMPEIVGTEFASVMPPP